MPDYTDRLITLVIPVKDEAREVVADVVFTAQAHGWRVLVVDDGSIVPCKLASIRFETSRGYGAAIKAGVRASKTDFVATMDGDGQHTAWDVKRLEDFLVYFKPDMVIGDRRLKEHGVRLWGRKVLNWTASVFARKWINDLNSGMRIFRRSIALGYEPILSDRFSFTTSITLSMLEDGYYVDWLPIKVWPRQSGQSRVKLWQDGLRTLWLILYIGLALRTRKVRGWLRRLRGK
jgi:glycosyltransferase involved in cell wall biosynthesis